MEANRRVKRAPGIHVSRRLGTTSQMGAGERAQERLQQLDTDKIPNVFGGHERRLTPLGKSLGVTWGP